MDEDRSKFPPDYAGHEINHGSTRTFAWTYKGEPQADVPEGHVNKATCLASAWMDHDARVLAETPLEPTVAMLVDWVGPTAAEEAAQTAQRWASRINDSLTAMWSSADLKDRVWPLLMMMLLGRLLIDISESIIKTAGAGTDRSNLQ